MKYSNLRKTLSLTGLFVITPISLVLISCSGNNQIDKNESEVDKLIREFNDFKTKELEAKTPDYLIRTKFEKSAELVSALQNVTNSLTLTFSNSQKDQTTQDYRRLDTDSLPNYIFYENKKIKDYESKFSIKILWDTWKEYSYKGQVEFRAYLFVTGEPNIKSQSILLKSEENSFRKKGNDGAKADQYIRNLQVKSSAIDKNLLASEWLDLYKNNLTNVLLNSTYPEQKDFFKIEVDLTKSLVDDINGIVNLKVTATDKNDAKNSATRNIQTQISGINSKRNALKAGIITANSSNKNHISDWQNMIYNQSILQSFKDNPAKIANNKIDNSSFVNKIEIMENTGNFLLELKNVYKGYQFSVAYTAFDFTNTSATITYEISFKNVKKGTEENLDATQNYSFTQSNTIKLIPPKN